MLTKYLAAILGFFVVAALFAIFWGWLVMVVLGWFGVNVTLWQGWVIAFLVSGLTKNTDTTSSK